MHRRQTSEFSRRGFMGAAVAGFSALGAGAGAQAQSQLAGGDAGGKAPAPPAVPFRNPYVYKFGIGDLEAYSISDCDLAFREGLDLMWPEQDRGEMREEMTRHGESLDSLPLYVNILVVKAGNEVAIFDAGFGRGNNPKMGWLMDGLAMAGIAPEQVTAGFLSHAHADHLNGFTQNGKPVFSNAAVYLLPEELSFWRGDAPDFSKSRRDKNQLPGMIRDVRARYDALGSHLQTVKDGTELFGGKVRVESAPGHTDGHACFRIRSGKDELLHLTDLAHHPLLMFTNPDWTIAFDHDPAKAVVSRKKYWAEASSKHTRCYGFHLPWPGLGHILDYGANSYRWWPEAARWAV